jgi:hypothetical protein
MVGIGWCPRRANMKFMIRKGRAVMKTLIPSDFLRTSLMKLVLQYIARIGELFDRLQRQ